MLDNWLNKLTFAFGIAFITGFLQLGFQHFLGTSGWPKVLLSNFDWYFEDSGKLKPGFWRRYFIQTLVVAVVLAFLMDYLNEPKTGEHRIILEDGKYQVK